MLVLSFAAVVLMAGCIKVQIREDIGSSGSSDLMMSLEPVNISAMGWDKKNPCDDFKANESSKLITQAKCRFDGKKETVTAKFDRKKAGGLTITGSKYRFDLVAALDGFNDNKSKKSTLTLPKVKNETQIREAKDSGFAYDYIIKMPGKVTSQSGGEIQSDGSVKFDIIELVESDRPYVESETGLGGLLGGSAGKAADKGEDKGAGSPCFCIPGLSVLLAAAGAAAAKFVL